MIPVAFSSNETIFPNTSAGRLSDAMSCTAEEVLNGIYELEMEYPIRGTNYEMLSERAIITAIPSPYRSAQPFRIYKIKKTMRGTMMVYARHISYDLRGIPVNPFTATGAAAAMTAVKNNSAISNPFTFWTDIQSSAQVSYNRPNACRDCLGGMEGSILDVFGGEYEWDKYNVNLHQTRGEKKNLVIKYGINMQSVNQDTNSENYYTGVYPYWYKAASGEDPEVLVTCNPPIIDASGTFDFERVLVVDLSNEFDEQPTPSQLQSAAQSYITKNQIATIEMNIMAEFSDIRKYIDPGDAALIDFCDLGDIITVQYSELGIDVDAKIVSIKTDVLQEVYKTVQIGSVRKNVARTIAKQQEEILKKIRNNILL